MLNETENETVSETESEIEPFISAECEAERKRYSEIAYQTASGIAYIRFYGKDWLTQPSLRLVSRAAKGLWIDLIAYMMSLPVPGVLAINGQPMSDAQIFMAVGGDPKETKAQLNELESLGIFSRTCEGHIYCRRMIKDVHNYAQKVRAGKLGGRVFPGQGKSKTPSKTPSKNINGTPSETTTERVGKTVNKQPSKPQTNSDMTQDSRSTKSKLVAVHSSESVTAGSQKNYYDDLENKVRKASGLENSPHPELSNMALINGLLDAGFDLDQDILPSIIRQASANPNISRVRTWRYFIPGIREDREKRMGVAAIPAARKSLNIPEKNRLPHFDEAKLAAHFETPEHRRACAMYGIRQRFLSNRISGPHDYINAEPWEKAELDAYYASGADHSERMEAAEKLWRENIVKMREECGYDATVLR